MSRKVGVVRFLGTNCDRDVWQAVESVGLTPEWLWYQDRFNALEYRALVLPGGFSYGDYLRSGALSAKMPVMDSVREAAEKGVPTLGICNGFQILCESHLLPGTLVKNSGLRFVDEWVDLKVSHSNPYWGGRQLESCRIPIAHGDGRYFISDEGLAELQEHRQIWWTYGNNPNGSREDIAGVMNKEKNVAGLMPHPERAIFDWMGNSEGRAFFASLIEG